MLRSMKRKGNGGVKATVRWGGFTFGRKGAQYSATLPHVTTGSDRARRSQVEMNQDVGKIVTMHYFLVGVKEPMDKNNLLLLFPPVRFRGDAPWARGQ
jgi:hypothetical protein